MITEKSEHEDKANLNKYGISDNTNQNFGQAKRVQEYNNNQTDIKNSEYLEQHLQTILQRDDD